eukprot:768248-Hanusia_phi.AAC.4
MYIMYNSRCHKTTGHEASNQEGYETPFKTKVARQWLELKQSKHRHPQLVLLQFNTQNKTKHINKISDPFVSIDFVGDSASTWKREEEQKAWATPGTWRSESEEKARLLEMDCGWGPSTVPRQR